MKQVFFFLLILLLSCSENKPQVQQQHNVPQALAEQKSDASLLTKRSGNDLIQDLYAELVAQSPALSSFEQTVQQLPGQKEDSLEYYKNFFNKNHQYYSATENYLNSIQDSVLKNKIKNLITESKTKFETNISVLKNLEQQMELKEKHLSDLHQAIKLVTTIAVIEKYQKENNPQQNPVKAMIRKYDNAILKADSILQKQILPK